MPAIHGVHVINDEPQMINLLSARCGRLLRAVQGQIVVTGGQIIIVRVGVPLDRHTEQIPVKVQHAFEVGCMQREMPQTACAGGRSKVLI